jgi:hypothetical protein
MQKGILVPALCPVTELVEVLPSAFFNVIFRF